MLNEIVENVNEIVSHLLEKLWTYQVLNVVVMVHNPSDPKHLDCYIWNPYTDGQCGKEFKNPNIVGTCLNEEIHTEISLFTLRAQLKTINLNGCPINVQTYIIEPYIIRDGDIIGNIIIREHRVCSICLLYRGINNFKSYSVHYLQT